MTKSLDFDDLGNRMKRYEQAEAGRRLMPGLPVIARLDGHSFHTYTKGLKRPYHLGLAQSMIETTIHLVEKYQATFGYTQSDEITLVFAPNGNDEFAMFNGKYQKLCSLMAATASVRFNHEASSRIPEKSGVEAEFDCRVWNVPSLEEAMNSVLWRQLDAVKNSVSMASQSLYTSQELHKKNTKTKIDMLKKKGIIWDEYPTFFKRGTFVRRVAEQRTLTPEILAKIPESKRPPADQLFIRHVVKEVEVPMLNSITNPVGVLFYNDTPMVYTDNTTV